jgi:hypothetical protein
MGGNKIKIKRRIRDGGHLLLPKDGGDYLWQLTKKST